MLERPSRLKLLTNGMAAVIKLPANLLPPSTGMGEISRINSGRVILLLVLEPDIYLPICKLSTIVGALEVELKQVCHSRKRCNSIL